LKLFTTSIILPRTLKGIETMHDEIIFNYKNRCDEFPQAEIDRLLAETKYEPRDARDAAFVMARWAYYQRSRAEATRLGLTPHPEQGFLHNPLALIEEAVSDEAGKAMAERWGFSWHEAGSMWDLLAERRDGDAIIALIGDDAAGRSTIPTGSRSPGRRLVSPPNWATRPGWCSDARPCLLRLVPATAACGHLAGTSERQDRSRAAAPLWWARCCTGRHADRVRAASAGSGQRAGYRGDASAGRTGVPSARRRE
jgi:hypothetical protein